MAKQYGKHGVAQKTHPLRIVIGSFAVICLVVGGVVAMRVFSSQSRTPEPAEKQATTKAPALAEVHFEPTLEAKATLERKAAEAAMPEEPVEVEEPAPTVEPATVNVMMVGDVLMHDELVDSGLQADGSYNFGFLFDHITDELAAADIKMLNQETVMGEPERGYHYYMGAGGPIMNTPTALADTEAEYGFNVILKATNHTLDLHYSGLSHELDYWKSAHPEIPVLGVDNPNLAKQDDSQDWVDNVYVGEYNGMKVGILNYTFWSNETVDYETDYMYLSFLDENKIREDVQKARDAGAEMLIACPHWGIEYDTVPENSANEMNYSRLFCELGVDVILGSHPHILQPVRILQNEEGHKTVCFYSMGNFVAAGGMPTRALVGGVARVTLQRTEDGTYSVSAASLAPTVICYTVGPHMSAWPIDEWTYELAAEGARPDLTPDFAYAFCSEVLGDGFSHETGEFTLDMNTEPTMV